MPFTVFLPEVIAEWNMWALCLGEKLSRVFKPEIKLVWPDQLDLLKKENWKTSWVEGLCLRKQWQSTGGGHTSAWKIPDQLPYCSLQDQSKSTAFCHLLPPGIIAHFNIAKFHHTERNLCTYLLGFISGLVAAPPLSANITSLSTI